MYFITIFMFHNVPSRDQTPSNRYYNKRGSFTSTVSL